jgi:hypothetical protein
MLALTVICAVKTCTAPFDWVNVYNFIQSKNFLETANLRNINKIYNHNNFHRMKLTIAKKILPLIVAEKPPFHHLKILEISNPIAYAIKPSSKTIPAICAYSINFSLGLLRVIISTMVNNA